MPALLRQIIPEGVRAETLLQHPGVIMQLFTNEGSPFKLDDAQLIEFTGRLHALAVAAADQPASLEAFLDAVNQDMSDPAMRIDGALDTILSYSLDLDESDPAIKDHRAWIIDRVLRRLTGDRYQTLRAYVHGYNEGIEPPEAD